jgi:hypothetical protein
MPAVFPPGRSMRSAWLSLLAATVGVVLLVGRLSTGPAAGHDARSCARGSVPTIIDASFTCLKTGKSCKSRYQAQYAKYGFQCHAGLLTKKPKPTLIGPGPTSSSPVTTAAPPASKAGVFAGTWWAIDPTDRSVEQVTFGDDGSISFQDSFATTCGGAAAYATSTGSANGNTWTASATTTLHCPDNDGSVPNLLFQFTFNPNGTLTFTGMPEIWTRTPPSTN